MPHKKILTDTTLAKLKIEALNAMQLISIETIEKNANTILLSKTGSGKTFAFLLPILHHLKKDISLTQAIIIVPSRELAIQIEKVFKSMGTEFKVSCCYGGHKREVEEKNLVQPPALLIGTPGRLCDHIRRGNITVGSIQTLVLDEFDKSLEMGFKEEMSFIVGSLPALNKRILTSATEAVEIPSFIGLSKPVKLNFISKQDADDIALAIKSVQSDEIDKPEMLFRLICHLGGQSSIVFCNQRETVETLSNYLSKKGILNEFYHGALEQKERDMALCKFRNGSVDILITTDLASRGLDIPHIRYIIHFNLPLTQDSFTHRNGRTARMEASGTGVLMLGSRDRIPAFISETVEAIHLRTEIEIPAKPKWITLFIAAGKKDKINKVDIVGFLTQKAQLKKEEIGLIEVKDFTSYVAIRKSKIAHVLELIRDEKIKNRKIKIEIAK